VKRLQLLEQDLMVSQEAQRQMENDLFKAREMLMESELRLFSMSEQKARLQSERDAAEASLMAFNLLHSGGRAAVNPKLLAPSNRQLAPLRESLEFVAADMRDSSGAALHQAQDLFDSLSALAACSQLFSAALDLCERCVLNASQQGLRMSNELGSLTEQANSMGLEQSTNVFVRQLEACSSRAVEISARMQQVMTALQAQ
jgi:hypothetical protein